MASLPDTEPFREALRAQIQGILAAAVDAGFEGHVDLEVASVGDGAGVVPRAREVRRLPAGAAPPPAGECLRFEVREGKYRQVAPVGPDYLA